MSAVYLVDSPSLPRREALKVISADQAAAQDMRALFIQEADISARLNHPNIVHIYNRGETEAGELWIAMEYVPGTDAETALQAGPLSTERCVHLVTEAARALDYAHRHDIVHQDIKPSNLLLTNEPGEVERVMISDFGAARTRSNTHSPSASMTASMAYAAPELISGDRGVDGRADVYSLACTFYRLLTGRYPFPAAELSAVASAHLNQEPPRITDHLPGVPRQLDAILAKALAKDPAGRYQSATDFSEAVAAAVRESAAVTQHRSISAAIAPNALHPPGAATGVRASGDRAPHVDFIGHLPRTQADLSTRRRKTAAVAGGLAVLILFGWMALQGSATPAPDSPTPAAASPTTSEQPNENTAALTTLRQLLPIGYVSGSCSPAPDTDSALAAATIDCGPIDDLGGPSSGRYTLGLSRSAVQALFARDVATAATVVCPGNIQSPGPWHRATNPTVAQGNVFCGRRQGRSVVAWTTEDKLFAAAVEAEDATLSMDQLYNWWRTHS